MAKITQVISPFPTAPDSSKDTPPEFNQKADAFVNHQAGIYVGEVNAWATQANSVRDDINNIVATIPDGSIDDINIALDRVYSNKKVNELNDAMVKRMAGVMFDFAGTTAPAGALPCNGQELLQSEYPELYAAIGDTWNNTNGVTTESGKFRLPPQNIGGLGLYTRGTGAVDVGVYQSDVFKSHSHTFTGEEQTGSIVMHGNGTATVLSGVSGVFSQEDTMTSYAQTTPASGANSIGIARFSMTPTGTNSAFGDTEETRPVSITVLKCIWTGR